MKIDVVDQNFLGTPQVIASYLLHGPDGPILIETGPASVQSTLDSRLRDLGVDPLDIRHVLVTHIHLDHSGGAGHWAKRGAKIYVHPKGAPHLVEPARLLASASRIYGDRMDELWGSTLPVAQDLVVPVEEGRFRIGTLEIEAWDTPGHAAHHLAFQVGEDLFTGDVAGVRLPGSAYVSVPAPPPEFHLETWLKSLDKLETAGAKRLHLTHFGGGFEAGDHLSQLRGRLGECVDFVSSNRALQGDDLAKVYQQWDASQAKVHGVNDQTYKAYEKANPSFMSAQGISRYLHKFRSVSD